MLSDIQLLRRRPAEDPDSESGQAARPYLEATPRICIGCFADGGALVEGALPTGGEQGAGGQFSGSFKIIQPMVHDLVGGFDSPFGEGMLDEVEFIIGFYEAFFQHTEIPAGLTGLLDLQSEVFDVPFKREFPAGLARLGDLHDGVAEGECVADAEFGFQEAFRGEVLAEGAVGEAGDVQFSAPVGIVLEGIDIHGFVGAAVVHEVGLAVTSEIGAGEVDGAGDGFFKYARGPGFHPAGEVRAFQGLGRADLNGEKLFHNGT